MAQFQSVNTRVRGIDSINLGHLLAVLVCILILFSPSLLYISIKTFDMLSQCSSPEGACTTPAGFHIFVTAVWGTILSLAATCGFLGTITSFFLRQTKTQPINTGRANATVVTYFGVREIVVTGFFGVIFGLLMIALFIGGFVNGSLFPRISPSSWTEINVRIETWAKIVVWCFLAGFSERLVPDFLDNLVHRVHPESNGQPNTNDDPDAGKGSTPDQTAMADGAGGGGRD